MRRYCLFLLCCLVLLCMALETCWADQTEVIRELSRTGGFLYPASVSVNPSDGSCWVADTYNNQVVHLASDGLTELSRADGFSGPWCVSVNPSDGSCWVADSDNNQIVHLAPDGNTELSRTGFLSYPVSVSVNPNDGSCWAAIRGWGWVIHLASDGTTILSQAGGFFSLESVSVNPGDGSCWVLDSGNNQVVHVAPDGTTELSRASGFSYPVRLSIVPSDGSCWVTDTYNNQVVHLAPDGVTEMSRASGFIAPASISVNPSDDTCWVADTGNNQIVHLASDGVTELSRTSGFSYPVCVSVNPGDGTCWVADMDNSQVVHLGPTSETLAIQSVTICRGRFIWEPGATDESYHESVQIAVWDLNGPQGLSVTTLAPDSTSHPTPDDFFSEWGDQYVLYQSWCRTGRGGTASSPAAGAYTITAQDPEGPTVSLVTAEAPELPPMFDITYPYNGEVIPEWEIQPVFSWEPLTGADQVCICVQTSTGEILWNRSGLPDTTTSMQYNDDGSANLSELSPGTTYRIHLRAVYEDNYANPTVTIRNYVGHTTEFTVYSPVPVIADMKVMRGPETSPDGVVTYHERVFAHLNDLDGIEDILSVIVTDSQGYAHEAIFRSDIGDWWWGIFGELYPSPAGTYTLTVTDKEGHAATAVTQVSAIPEEELAILAPPNNSVTSTTPLFSWSGPVNNCPCLGLREVNGLCAVWCGGLYVTDSPVTVIYNHNGWATQPELTPGRLYEWFISPDIADPIEQTDPRVASWFDPIVCARFWVEPQFLGFLPPIKNDGSSIFKLGSTVPVKFQLLNADGSYKSDASATLSIAFLDHGIVGQYYEAVSTAAPDSGNAFRYDASANQYLLNLGTKQLTQGTGTYSLQVSVNGTLAKEVLISLK